MMNFLIRIFVKITGIIPAAIYYKPSVKKEKGSRVKGEELMIVSNHKSLFDFPLWIIVFWYKNIHTLIAEVLYSKNAALSWLLNRLGGIKVDRDAKTVDFITKAEKILNKGGNVLVFPEGQLPRTPELGEFRPSAAYIALETGAAVLPVYTDGNYGIFKRTHCIIGKPVNIYELADLDGSEDRETALNKANNALREEILRLSRLAEEKRK